MSKKYILKIDKKTLFVEKELVKKVNTQFIKIYDKRLDKIGPIFTIFIIWCVVTPTQDLNKIVSKFVENTG